MWLDLLSLSSVWFLQACYAVIGVSEMGLTNGLIISRIRRV